MATINFACHPKDTPITGLNGPGQRFALWVQGCKLMCTSQCISPQLLEMKPRYVLTAEEAWGILRGRAKHYEGDIEGITFLGGEPTEQAVGLAAIATLARTYGWSVVTYSGHTIESLRQCGRPGVARLLEQTDILIDGPYIPRLGNPSLRWRGSSNQRIIVLTQRYSAEDLITHPICKGADITVTADRQLIVSGLQDTTILKDLVESLKRRGIVEQ